MESSLTQIIGRGPVHFVGIGGISMSGLAKILLHRGISVTGSDWQESEAVTQLRELGASVCVPHNGSSIGGQTLVVHTAAIPPNNPELLEAARQGIPVMNRGTFLGDLAAGYGDTAAVAGTHGKTTSTGMLATVMMAAGLDPTVHIGGVLPSIGGNTRLGGPDHFVMEACEYKNSFLDFHPNRALILNIEADHLDFFRDLADILDSFERFSQNLPDEGSLVVNLNDAGCRTLCGRLRRSYCGYALDPLETSVLSAAADAEAVYAGSAMTFQEGKAQFDMLLDGRKIARIGLAVPGRHNASNAIGCFALCHRMGIDPVVIADGLSLFTGTGRRFERKGTVNGALLIDDYAHHPTAIAATFETARKMTDGRILCIFQPHTYTRTLELYEDFAHVLARADEVLLLDIYAAREPDLGLVDASSLAGRIGEVGGHAVYLPSFHDAAIRMAEMAREGDIIFTMGAGDVFRVGEELLVLNSRTQTDG